MNVAEPQSPVFVLYYSLGWMLITEDHMATNRPRTRQVLTSTSGLRAMIRRSRFWVPVLWPDGYEYEDDFLFVDVTRT
jgi:hypothetical protein